MRRPGRNRADGGQMNITFADRVRLHAARLVPLLLFVIPLVLAACGNSSGGGNGGY